MTNLEKIIEILKAHKGELLNKFGVIKIGVFGSFVRGEETSESDIDIL